MYDSFQFLPIISVWFLSICILVPSMLNLIIVYWVMVDQTLTRDTVNGFPVWNSWWAEMHARIRLKLDFFFGFYFHFCYLIIYRKIWKTRFKILFDLIWLHMIYWIVLDIQQRILLFLVTLVICLKLFRCSYQHAIKQSITFSK